MCNDLLFINPFAVDSLTVMPELDDRVHEAEYGLGAFIQAKLGKEAEEAYWAVINGTVTNMAYNKDVITDEHTKKEITAAWRDLGTVRDWLKAQGALPLKEQEAQPA